MNYTNETATKTVILLIRFNFIVEPILYILTILGNSITIAAICSYRQMRNINNAIIISLAFADLFAGLNGLVFWTIIQGIPEAAGVIFSVNWSNQFLFLLQGIPLAAYILHLIALGVERSIAVFLPLRFNEIVNKKFMTILLFTTWILAFILMGNTLWPMLNDDPVKLHYDYWLITTITSYTMYCLVITSLLAMSVKTLLIVRKKIQILPGQILQNPKHSTISKATKRCTLIFLAYVITYTPMTVSTLLLIRPEEYLFEITVIFPLFRNIILSNSCVNIIVYCVSSKKYRCAYVRFLQKMQKNISAMFLNIK